MAKSDTCKITILNWEKYNPRADVKRPSWFRLEHSIITDPDFYDFDGEEFKAFIYILSQASSKNAKSIRINFDHALNACRIPKKSVLSAIEKLEELQILLVGDTDTVRKRDADDTDLPSTNERTNERTPIVPTGGDGEDPHLEKKFQELSAQYTELPKTTSGQKARERFFDQFPSCEATQELEAAIKNYKAYLRADSWRSPKTTFANFLGTKRSGLFWREYIKPVKLVNQPRVAMGELAEKLVHEPEPGEVVWGD